MQEGGRTNRRGRFKIGGHEQIEIHKEVRGTRSKQTKDRGRLCGLNLTGNQSW